MFIPYENLANIIPSKLLKDFFYNLKISQNVNYIKSNKTRILNQLKKVVKKRPLKVCFYVYDESKWKCQSLYDLLEKDSNFIPVILVTKTAAKNIDNPSYQTVDNVVRTYNFFISKGMRVNYAYDIDNNLFLPFEQFKPDIVIYQHPWYVETSQGPVVCSKFALTYYVPYYFPTTTASHDYSLRFHQYVQRYCIFDEITRKEYCSKMQNKGENLVVTGQPSFDLLQNQALLSSDKNEYVIYAPHWSVNKQSVAYATFEWNGEFMLQFAKMHPEYSWVFKPHPLLAKTLVDNNIMTKDEVDNYYNEWAKCGIVHDSGDYYDLFLKSKLMITDCSTFLGEYFLTQKPLIHLRSEYSVPFNQTVKKLIDYYYQVKNIDELQYALENVLKNDYLKQDRVKAYNEFGYANSYASQNILDDINKLLGL
jgi:CDP-glycerol glycerophosphotransferase (TagB/SpsB family)